MKRILVGAAAAAALIAPGVASADVQGAVDFTYENTDYDSGSGFDAYSLGGAIAVDVSHGLTLQVDGRTTMQDWGFGDYSHGYTTAHLSTDLGAFDLGGFAGIVNYYGEPGVQFGVEGRTHWNQFSFDGAISQTDFDDADFDVTDYRIGGAYFFIPNFAVSAGYAQADADSTGSSAEIDEWSLGAAYQFANNIELFGNWTNADYEFSGGGENESEALQIGVRLNIGGGTLQDNANDGLWTSARDINDTLIRY